jgi:putative membrane protein
MLVKNPVVPTVAALLLCVTPACALDASGPTDPEIAHIAYTAGVLDAAAGSAAATKSTNPAVRQFAETMVRDHNSVNAKALELVEKLKVSPQPNAISEALSTQAKETSARLANLKGAEFDRAYVQNEVEFHRAVNDALRTTLIPSADNAELKALLETGLSLFEAHQKHAEHLAAELK